MVIVVFKGFGVFKCRVVVCHDDGFSFGSLPQTISYWGHSRFADCWGCSLTSIPLILCLVFHRAGFLVGGQLLACALNELAPSILVQYMAKYSGGALLGHSGSRILLDNSSLMMLNLDCFRVASNSMGSPLLCWLLFVGLNVLSGFCGIRVSLWIFCVGVDSWMSLIIDSVVSIRMAHWAMASRPSYSSLLAPNPFRSSIFIHPRISSPPVELSHSGSLATRRNSFQYSVTDRLPCFMFFNLILASPLASITPNCLCNSALNPAQLSQLGVIHSSAYGVSQVPASSLRRLVAYRMFFSVWPSCHPPIL